MSIELNRDNYESETLQSEKPVLVDFWGPQCRPCLALMPVIHELEEVYENRLKVAKVNVTQNRMLCARLRIMSVPAYLFYKDGEERNRLVGENITRSAIVEAIEALVD